MSIPVDFNYYYPTTVPPRSDLLRTKERRVELAHAAMHLIGSDYQLTEVTMHFAHGSVILTVQPIDDPEESASCVIDAVATRFFQEKKKYIASINPTLAVKLENLSDREDIEKIVNIFYFTLDNYLKENPNDRDVTDTTIAETRLGLKNPKICRTEVMDINHWRLNDIPKFKEFIQSLPTSILDTRRSKKIMPFLQKALEQKQSLQDKGLYLRQVIGFLLLQEVFKNILEDTKLSIAIDKQNMYSCRSRNPDLNQENSYYAYRSERINETLSKIPINSILTLIPLACRSHPSKLSDFDLLNKDPESQHPFVINSEYLAQECNNAREADIALRQLLEESFHVSPQSFLEKDDYFEMKDLESFLMGISGLAISPGLYGRLPMKDHHTIYYKREGIVHIPEVSDNVLCEFLITAAQFLFEKEYDWMENSCSAYLEQMMGSPSIYELDTIKAKFQTIREVVQRLPIENLLKLESKDNRYILRNSGVKKLQALYQQGRHMSGLQHPSPNTASSSCLIS